MRIQSIITAAGLALSALLYTTPATAQDIDLEDNRYRGDILIDLEPTSFYEPFVITVDGEELDLTIEPVDASAGQFEGFLGNDRATGYRRNARVVVIRWRNGEPFEAYVGSYRQGFAFRSSSFNGIVYALSADAGATDQANRRRFSGSQGPFFINQTRPTLFPTQPQPLPRANDPIDVAHGGWVSSSNNMSSSAERPMVLDLNGDGEAIGWFHGDEIVGHYARDTGSLAFVRFNNGDAIQFYHILLEDQPGQQPGEFYALTDWAGGNWTATNTFPFTMRDRVPFNFIRHEWEIVSESRVQLWCLGVGRFSATRQGEPVRQVECNRGDSDQIAIVPLWRNGDVALVFRESGKCITAPRGSVGARAEQRECSFGPDQAFQLPQYVNNRFFFIRPTAYPNACLRTRDPRSGIELTVDFDPSCQPANRPSPFTQGRTWSPREAPTP